MAGSSNGFTPTQRRILAVLADGRLHPKSDLQACLDDELAGGTAVNAHLTGIRKKLRPRGEDVVFHQVDGESMYCHVRLLANPYHG